MCNWQDTCLLWRAWIISSTRRNSLPLLFVLRRCTVDFACLNWVIHDFQSQAHLCAAGQLGADNVVQLNTDSGRDWPFVMEVYKHHFLDKWQENRFYHLTIANTHLYYFQMNVLLTVWNLFFFQMVPEILVVNKCENKTEGSIEDMPSTLLTICCPGSLGDLGHLNMSCWHANMLTMTVLTCVHWLLREFAPNHKRQPCNFSDPLSKCRNLKTLTCWCHYKTGGSPKSMKIHPLCTVHVWTTFHGDLL